MKKAIVLTMVLILGIGLAVFADNSTVSSTTWSGAGLITGSVTSGDDAVHSFEANGGQIQGSFNVTDANNNPYGYSVDTVTGTLDSTVQGGYSWYDVVRTDFATHPSAGESGTTPYMYEDAGQHLYSYIGSSSDGSASMEMTSLIAYAYLSNTSSGFHADADSFVLSTWLGDKGGPTTPATGPWAAFSAQGSGQADVNLWHSSIGSWGPNNQVNFGWGMGSYTKCNASFVGSGQFSVDALGASRIATQIANASGTVNGWIGTGDGTLGSVAYHASAVYTGTLTVPNYSMSSK